MLTLVVLGLAGLAVVALFALLNAVVFAANQFLAIRLALEAMSDHVARRPGGIPSTPLRGLRD